MMRIAALSWILFIALVTVAHGLSSPFSRRRLWQQSSAAILLGASVWQPAKVEADDLTVYKLPSGLKYLELVKGDGPSPQYGNLVSIAYTSYIKLPASSKNPNPQPQQFDRQASYLYKHGNGRMIAGLDEGLHTMKVGGRRRLIIPPKLGYTDIGLGPMPEAPWDRFRLNQLIDDMVELKGGNIVMEVTLLNVIEDEADQGYYGDASLSPEDFETLKANLQRKAAAAQAQRQPKAADV